MVNDWWSEEYGFFGDFYIEGDNSQEGYLIEHSQSLSERTEIEVSGVIKLLSLSESAKLLDCPCGYGRHSINLAKGGYEVTGVDVNSQHLNKARDDAKDLNISFLQQNMLGMNFDNEFDGAINMFYSFGFFESDEENEKVLANFFQSLKKGGKFLMHTDVNIPRIIEGKYKEDEERTLKNGRTLRIIDNYNPRTKRIEGAWIIKDDSGKEIRKDYSVRVYTKEEFIEMCFRAGFTKCEAFSDWKGKPYSEDAEDMIIVAEK